MRTNQPILCTVMLLASMACGSDTGNPAPEPVELPIINGQGDMAGEVTDTSVILQSRLTTTAGFDGTDIAGAPGVAWFEIATSPQFDGLMTSDQLDASAERDFIVKTRVEGLEPGTRYYYRLVYGTNLDLVATGPTRSFSTLAGANIAREASFVAVTGMNYHQFYRNAARAYTGPDKNLGYPALEAIRALAPDFFVATGDNVYYDVPYGTRADTAGTMRQKWHEQLVQPRFIDLFSEVPTYWEKDDHDYRYNDCDNTSDLTPSVEMGAAIFLEQVPVADPADPAPLTYRTHRVSQDLQIWLTEGRDHRSPNMMEQGPDKTLWGDAQLAWLKRTLLESDATFKILISPTPMIGPDDAEQAGRNAEGHDPIKRDNHSNPEGFQRERDAFWDWLDENGRVGGNFYTVVGDRHWQYHSRHPRGFEEFSTGAIIDANSRVGRPPGDPDSNDPNAQIEQLYTYEEPTGGFLRVTVTPGVTPEALFSFFDETGRLLYEERKTAS